MVPFLAFLRMSGSQLREVSLLILVANASPVANAEGETDASFEDAEADRADVVAGGGIPLQSR